MDNKTKSVIDSIGSDLDNVEDYDQLVNAYMQLCDQASVADSELDFEGVEKAAIAALSGSSVVPPSVGHVGQRVSRMINSFNYPAYLVSTSGLIAGGNETAWREFALNANDSIDRLPFTFDAAEKISQIIAKTLHGEQSKQEPTLVLKRTCSSKGGQGATIAVSVTNQRDPICLVFIITTKWRRESALLLQKQFALTKAEVDILLSFVDGQSSLDIAKSRSRSHDTIRTQFQSIREKLGAKNQTELLRTVLSVSSFTENISGISDAVERPYRIKTENMVSAGRVVEATLMGDFNGDPIMMIASGAHYTFNAEFEELLYQSGLLVISVCPPGWGDTDLEPNGVSWRDQTAEDVRAIMHQLDVSSAAMLINYVNAPLSYHVVKSSPLLFAHIFQVSTCGPIAYDVPKRGRSSWVSSIIRSSTNNKAVQELLIRGGVNAWVTLGAKRFTKLQHSGNPCDAKVAMRDDNIREFQHALDTATSGGNAKLIQEQTLVFENWSDQIESNPTTITAIHGIQNSLFSIESVRALASTFPDKINLIEIEGAGQMLFLSHPARVISIIRSTLDGDSKRLPLYGDHQVADDQQLVT